MKRATSIQMTFECNQDWDAMKVTACGRFCDVCKKEVIDFTKKSKADYLALYEKNATLCGRFKNEQVDLSLIKPIQLPFSKQLLIWFSGLLLSFGSKNAIAQKDTVKTEQNPTITPLAAEHFGSIKIQKPTPPVTASASDDRSVRGYYRAPSQKPFLTTKRRMYYWTKRFPFIRGVRRGSSITMGAIRFL